MTKANIKTKLLDEGQLNTFQYAKWQLALKHTSITIIAIYHSPPLNPTRVTNGEFLDEFADWTAESVSTSNNVILVGDFNLHINNPNDDHACNFLETTQALGLHQNITFPTHVSGNTLDLIFSEANNNIKVEECTQGDYISDHCMITCILRIDKPITTRKEIIYCNVKLVNVLNMASDIRKGLMDSSTKSTSLEDMVMQFESILKSSLDNHAPVKTKLMPLQKLTPWFTEEVKILNQTMQRREKIWSKYKLDSTWIAFKVARNRYKNALREAKLLVVSEKVVECGTNTCKLYSLVNSLTGATITNPMPDHQGSDKELADKFSEFFMDNNTKIRQ